MNEIEQDTPALSEEPDIFQRVTVEENIYNSRGLSKLPAANSSPKDICKQMSCCAQMHSCNWTDQIMDNGADDDFNVVEVRFKNTHKDFYRIPQEEVHAYSCGDIVAVEGNPGHDIGIISLKGALARLQMKNKGVDPNSEHIKKLYRKARQTDIDKWQETILAEKDIQRRARVIAAELGLNMKINNVEFQGDFTKAIFYYTAEDRVDFRQLIKRYAEEFKIRIEMKQIGARQEAGNLGGIGSCGRELCCVTFLHNFTSVSTQAARIQQVSLNPQKLAGQCGKLKCCLNYEYDVYTDALKDFPDTKFAFETGKGKAKCVKFDVFQEKLWYTYDSEPNVLHELSATEVKKLIQMAKEKQSIESLDIFKTNTAEESPKDEFQNGVDQDDLTRFDRPSSKGKSHEESRRKKKKSSRSHKPELGKPIPNGSKPHQNDNKNN